MSHEFILPDSSIPYTFKMTNFIQTFMNIPFVKYVVNIILS